ncbi:uncharacterized protein METZ01_LOCUS462465 [marine metagenome]|uniref:Uncharacterized protein n=1 Tax=marine metagenome TaxID=408172 RepID=A0A383APW0_9ZZZZ
MVEYSGRLNSITKIQIDKATTPSPIFTNYLFTQRP